MRIWRDLTEVEESLARTAVTIGNFDGVHVGHRFVLAQAREVMARVHDGGGADPASLVAVTFDPHPMAVVRPDTAPEMITTLDRRVALLGEAGADAVLVLPFTRELSQWSAEEFVRRILVETLHAVAVVVGENFRYGHRAAGDVDLLRWLGDEHDFTAYGLDLHAEARDQPVSSSYVRECLAAGDVAAAAAVLGRPHAVEGVVAEGDRRGKGLGYPTANVGVPEGVVVPADGVYAGWLRIVGEDGAYEERLPAAISAGSNPTFDGAAHRVEAYVLDRDDLDLYGKRVAIELAERIRGMERFDSVEALQAQMADDVAATRRILAATTPAA